MIGNDWRMTFAEESEGELSHYGKKGMKWGKRNNAAGSTAAPSLGRAIALGGGALSLQKQSRFKDSKALKQRQAAGKNLSIAMLTGLAGTAASALASGSNNQAVKAGAGIVSKILGTASTVTVAVGVVQNVSSVVTERKSRAANA